MCGFVRRIFESIIEKKITLLDYLLVLVSSCECFDHACPHPTSMLHSLYVVVVQLAVCQIDPAHKQTVVLYHETQPEYQALGMMNQNTGDIFGDAYFVLRSVSLPVECLSKNPLAHFDCDNPEQNDTATNVISMNIVDVDDRWSVYGTCNVNEQTKTYSCECKVPGQLSHKCNASVGRSLIYSRESAPSGGKGENWQWWRVNLARKMGGGPAGGAWYSTTSGGSCHGNTSATCYWRLKETKRTIASTCLLHRVGDAVVASNRTCFDSCPQPTNQSSVCWVECFMGNVLGPDGSVKLINASAGIPIGTITAAWNGAFAPVANGGCPGH